MNQMWGRMPGWAKFLAIFMSAVMLTLGVSNREALLSTVTGLDGAVVKSVATDTVEVEFLVYSEDGNDPIDRAKVQFIFDGAPEPRLTNSDGFVKIEVPRRDDINVVIKKEGFKDLTRTINLLVGGETTVPYFLETDESFSSYNLRGSGMPEGIRFRVSSITTMDIEQSDGDPINSNIQDPFIEQDSIEESNEEAEYEFTKVENGQPTQIIKKVEKDRSSVTANMRVIARDEDKSYEYDKTLSEVGAFEDREILSKRSSRKWVHELIGKRATETQRAKLAKSKDAYEAISYEYPKGRVRVGDSWDFDSVLGVTDLTVTSSNIVATLSDITYYEGENVALISVKGNSSATGVDSGESSQSNSSESDKSMVEQISEYFAASLLKDIVVDYAVPGVTRQISEDLFYDEFTLSDKIKSNSPKAYDGLIEIYQEVSNREEFGSYTLPTIEAIVGDKVNEKNIPELLAGSTDSWLSSGTSDIGTSVSSSKTTYDISVDGNIYRSLKYPIDLLIDLDLTAIIESPSSIEDPGSKQNIKATYKIKSSVI